jgi:methionyl-tRNA formyltransferase
MAGRRALFLTAPHPVAAAVMRGWLAGGNTIAGIWYPEQLRKGLENSDRRLGLFAPQWSVSAISGKHRIPITLIPRMGTWNQRMEAVGQTGADVLISVYFLNIVPSDVIDHFSGRCVNFHPAPLPRYRGPSPIEAMIADRALADLSCMTLHVLDKGIDTGAIIATRPAVLPPDGDLVRHMLELARTARILAQTKLLEYLEGRLLPTPQDENLANHVRVYQSDLALSALLSCDEAEWRLKTFGRKKHLYISGLGKTRVCAFVRKLSLPTGEPPRVGLLTVDMDLADARVRLKRKRPWTKSLRSITEYLTYVAVKDHPDKAG